MKGLIEPKDKWTDARVSDNLASEEIEAELKMYYLKLNLWLERVLEKDYRNFPLSMWRDFCHSSVPYVAWML